MPIFYFALLLSLFAGLSTTLGSLLVFVVSRPSDRFMAITLGFAAGVMLIVSFMELLPRAFGELNYVHAYFYFFIGMGVMFLLDMLIPHSYEGVEDTLRGHRRKPLLKVGVLVALGIGIHNFPEGMAAFAATLADRNMGIAVALAVAMHNIPEGLAVATPIYAATDSKKKAFFWSFLSGICEPIGALAAAVVLLPFLSSEVLAAVIAGVAGMMVFISLDELLPAAREYEEEHLSIIGTIAGMVIMAVSLGMLGR